MRVDVKVGVNLLSPRPLIAFFFFNTFLSAWVLVVETEQLLTVDPSARASMKNAANCDT